MQRQVRQLLADKISGNLVGLWLLIPEYLRLGLWDLLLGWTAHKGEAISPRLALQLINEAVLGVKGIRHRRTLSQKGFEVANGLPFVAADAPIHDLLNEHTVAEAIALQITLGKVRRSLGHFKGDVFALDPHRLPSFSKRQMVRLRKDYKGPAAKMAQTFFLFDVKTQQPVCFTTASSARNVTQASPELLEIAASIVECKHPPLPLVLADSEHFTVDLFEAVRNQGCFDLLVPMPAQPNMLKSLRALSEDSFTRHWAGYGTCKLPYRFKNHTGPPCVQFVQRKGEPPRPCELKAFLCSADRNELEDLTAHFPDRWHIEEFFRHYQTLGWDHAGTLNLNIRYGKMTLALIAQAASHMLRQRLGEPFRSWNAEHLGKDFFRALEGDIRVQDDTILVTYYNAPQAHRLKRHYQNLPHKLALEGIPCTIPWLYNFKLDFRFK